MNAYGVRRMTWLRFVISSWLGLWLAAPVRSAPLSPPKPALSQAEGLGGMEGEPAAKAAEVLARGAAAMAGRPPFRATLVVTIATDGQQQEHRAALAFQPPNRFVYRFEGVPPIAFGRTNLASDGESLWSVWEQLFLKCVPLRDGTYLDHWYRHVPLVYFLWFPFEDLRARFAVAGPEPAEIAGREVQVVELFVADDHGEIVTQVPYAEEEMQFIVRPWKDPTRWRLAFDAQTGLLVGLEREGNMLAVEAVEAESLGEGDRLPTRWKMSVTPYYRGPFTGEMRLENVEVNADLADETFRLEPGEELLFFESTHSTVETCRAALAQKPDDPHLRYTLALRLIEAGQSAGAQEELRRAIDLQPKAIAANIDLARLLTSAGHREEALQVLQQAVQRQPDSVRARYELGMALENVGRAEEAIQECETCVHLCEAENWFDERWWRGALQGLGAIHARQGQEEEALNAYLRAIVRNPRPGYGGGVARSLAFLARKLDALERVIAELRATAEADPRSVDKPLALGAALLAAGDAPGAAAAFQRALAAAPSYSRITTFIAELYRDTQRPEEVEQWIAFLPPLEAGEIHAELGQDAAALAAFRRAVELAPDDLYARTRLAYAAVRAGEPETGLAEVEELLRRAPEDPSMRLVAACVRLNAGVAEAALAALESYAQLRAGGPDPYREMVREIRRRCYVQLGQRGDLGQLIEDYLQEGQEEAALRAYAEAAEPPALPLEVALRVGELCEQRGDPERAVTAFHAALEADPTHLPAARGLVRALLDLGRWDEALLEAEAATDAHPDQAAAYALLGDVQAWRPEAEDLALEAYEEALKRDANLTDAHFGRAVVLERLEETEEAAAAWARFLAVEPEGERAWQVRNGLAPVAEENLTLAIAGAPKNQPAWSPDGKKIAFCRGWDWNIWVKDLRTDEEWPVTTGGLNDMSLHWSPDGRTLLFVKRSQDYNRVELYTAPADGAGPEARLLDFSPAQQARWSPDGSFILFDGPDGMWTVRPDGTEAGPAAFAQALGRRYRWPSLSPDGQRLACQEGGVPRGNPGPIVVFPLQAPDQKQILTRPGTCNQYPSFSPDGRFVAFCSDAGGKSFDLYVAPADGSHPPVRLARCGYDANWGFQPAWSPDGRRIAFTRPVFGDVWAVTLGGLDTRPLGLTAEFPPDGLRVTVTNRTDAPVRVTVRGCVFDVDSVQVGEGPIEGEPAEVPPGAAREWTLPLEGPPGGTVRVEALTDQGVRSLQGVDLP